MAEYSISQLTTEATEPKDNDLYEVAIDNGDDTFSSAKQTRSTLVRGLATEDALVGHATDSSNPHGVSKHQVGLADVPNTDATQRSNHTGTQAIETITGLQSSLDAKANTDAIPASLTDLDTTVSGSELDAIKDKVDGIANGATANATDADLRDRSTHTGTQAIETIAGLGSALESKADTSSLGTAATADTTDFATAAQGELAESALQLADIADFETTAELNARDTANRSRANHTGTQTASTISNFNTAADARITAQKGQSNGLATPDGSGKVPSTQLTSYVDDVIEFDDTDDFPETGEVGKIYVALDTDKVYRWGGSAYTEISPSPGSTDAVPEGSTNQYFTDERASAAAPVQSVAGKSGDVELAKEDVGLGNVPNVDATDRSNHTGTQAQSTVTNLEGDLAGKQLRTALTVGTSGADYTDLQSAINASHAGSIKTVRVTTPITISSMVTLYPDVRLEGSGDLTPISITSDFSSGVALRENSGAAHGQTLVDITVDLSAKANVGGVHIYQGDFVRLIRLHVTGQDFTSASKWTVRVGNFSSADTEGTASHNTIIEDLRIVNCKAGTYEQLLFVNQQDARIINPHFENNDNSLAYELMLYINNKNVVIENPHFEDPSANAIGMMESDGVIIRNVTGTFTQDAKLITIINTRNVLIDGVLASNTKESPASTVIGFFDRLNGPDGYTQIVDDTVKVTFRNFKVSGWKSFVVAHTAGTILGTPYTMN